MPKPFTWVLHDPAGTSEFKPMEGVEVERGEAPQPDSGDAGAAAQAGGADGGGDSAAAGGGGGSAGEEGAAQ